MLCLFSVSPPVARGYADLVKGPYNFFPKYLHAANALFTPSSWNP